MNAVSCANPNKEVLVKFTGYKELILAFTLALTLWYGVSGSEKLESQLEVRVEYHGLPPGLVVRKGYIGKVSLRLRASAGVLRSITERDFSVLMDLSGVREGENILAVNPAYLPMRGGVEVIEVAPSRIELDVDSLASRTIPLTPLVQGAVPGAMETTVTFVPPEVTISGAASLIRDIDKLEIPVRIDLPQAPGISESRRTLPLPDGVDADPAEVAVVVQAVMKRRLLGIVRNVLFDREAAGGKVAVPDKVRITVRLTESSAASAASDPDIRAYVRPDPGGGAALLPVQVDLPAPVELVSVDPPRVRLEKPRAPATVKAVQPPSGKKPSKVRATPSKDKKKK
jgi:YbbR domain-containing protein